jgi:hypothetical protein
MHKPSGDPTGDLSSGPSECEVDAWAESIGLTCYSHPVQKGDVFSLCDALGVHVVEGGCPPNHG